MKLSNDNELLIENKMYSQGYTLKDIVESGRKRLEKFCFETYEPDILAKVTFFKDTDDSRKTPAVTGYRPAHQILSDYLTSGEHIYFEDDAVFPGETVNAYIRFISPEYYQKSLKIGMELNFNEGSRVVGSITVTKIFNDILSNE